MDNDRTPLSVVIAPANEHETRHIERLLDAAVVKLPREIRLLYDCADDSEPLRVQLESRGVNLVCPHRKNRVPAKRQGMAACYAAAATAERSNTRMRGCKPTDGSLTLECLFLSWVQPAYLFAILKRF